MSISAISAPPNGTTVVKEAVVTGALGPKQEVIAPQAARMEVRPTASTTPKASYDVAPALAPQKVASSKSGIDAAAPTDWKPLALGVAVVLGLWFLVKRKN